jgi:hypothetical protein
MKFETLFDLHPTQSPLEFLLRTTDLMRPFLHDLDGQHYDICQVLPRDAPAAQKFATLPLTALTICEEMILAIRAAMSAPDQDTFSVQAAFWRFLVNQIQTRSDAVKEMSAALQSGNTGDVNDALGQQSHLLSELAALLGQFDEKDWATGKDSTVPNDRHDCNRELAASAA